MLEINTIHNIDCREGLKLIDNNSIDSCVTSPPYWGLRDYGIVLDPFMGSGTTAMVALENKRNYLGFELNPEYVELANRYRLDQVQLKII